MSLPQSTAVIDRRYRESCCLNPGAQHFRHAPGLCNATARHVRFARIEHFADRADAIVTQVDGEHFEKLARARLVIGMKFHPCIDEWSDQPRPYCSLMIRAIA